MHPASRFATVGIGAVSETQSTVLLTPAELDLIRYNMFSVTKKSSHWQWQHGCWYSHEETSVILGPAYYTDVGASRCSRKADAEEVQPSPAHVTADPAHWLLRRFVTVSGVAARAFACRR